MPLRATELRQNVYRILDSVLESGVPVEIERRGELLRIVPVRPPSKFNNLVRLDAVIVGDPLDLIQNDWT